MLTKEIFRDKAKTGAFSEEEISQVERALESLNNVKNIIVQRKKGKGGLSLLVKNFFTGYNAPGIWKQLTESLLLLCIVIGIIIFGYAGTLEPILVVTLLATIIGFIFGKMR